MAGATDPAAGGGTTPHAVDPSAEGLQAAAVDSVTIAFGDLDAELYGVARLGLARDQEGKVHGSVLAVLFAGHASVAAVVRGALPVPDDAGWEALELQGLAMRTDAPLQRWSTRLRAEEGGFDLELEAIGAPAVLAADSAVGGLGGMTGYEQPVRVRGTVEAGGRTRTIDALGQRSHSWGDPDWERMALARTVTAWTPQRAVTLSAIRPLGAQEHDEEAVWSVLWEPEGILEVEDPRLSTTYDEGGRTRRAGLELWPATASEHDGWARRAAGDVLCGTTLDLGALELDVAFFRWRLEGRQGVGRYDVLRRGAAPPDVDLDVVAPDGADA
jgi:hypothetical protein